MNVENVGSSVASSLSLTPKARQPEPAAEEKAQTQVAQSAKDDQVFVGGKQQEQFPPARYLRLTRLRRGRIPGQGPVEFSGVEPEHFRKDGAARPRRKGQPRGDAAIGDEGQAGQPLFLDVDRVQDPAGDGQPSRAASWNGRRKTIVLDVVRVPKVIAVIALAGGRARYRACVAGAAACRTAGNTSLSS